MPRSNTLACHRKPTVADGKSRTPGVGDREHPVKVSENTRHGNRRPRTPGAGDREQPVRVAKNTRHGNRRPRTPGAGDREHRVWETENTRSREPRTLGTGNRELPALVRALRTPGARTRVSFGRRGALFIPAFYEVFSPTLQ